MRGAAPAPDRPTTTVAARFKRECRWIERCSDAEDQRGSPGNGGWIRHGAVCRGPGRKTTFWTRLAILPGASRGRVRVLDGDVAWSDKE